MGETYFHEDSENMKVSVRASRSRLERLRVYE